MSSIIKEYYLLNSIQIGGKRHFISDFKKNDIKCILSENEINTYLREISASNYITRETIVGGADESVIVLIE